jgi:ribonucleoside-diphosphate reductase beta chain
MYSTFAQHNHDHMLEPMFMGNSVNIARYDEYKTPVFEKLIEKQLSFFWRPEEVDLSKDKRDFIKLPPEQQHIFLSNLKYQTLLDSIQGKGPNVAFLPLVSMPTLETWIETWSFSETIHSRSYTHIMRNVLTDPKEVLDDIVNNTDIMKRAESITKYYDHLILLTNIYNSYGEGFHIIEGKKIRVTKRDIKKALYLCMMSINVLEAVRFYVSFACTFAFSERELMEGNGKILKLIARDEQLHLTGTQQILNMWADGKDDPEMAEIAIECFQDSIEIFLEAANQEKEWADYLFKDGSMIGLNKAILSQYVDYITNDRMRAVGLPAMFEGANHNPIPWMSKYLQSDNVQVAPQEAEISSYLVGQIDSDIGEEAFTEHALD